MYYGILRRLEGMIRIFIRADLVYGTECWAVKRETSVIIMKADFKYYWEQGSFVVMVILNAVMNFSSGQMGAKSKILICWRESVWPLSTTFSSIIQYVYLTDCIPVYISGPILPVSFLFFFFFLICRISQVIFTACSLEAYIF